MYKITNYDNDKLTECGYIKNQNGYSKILKNGKYNFLDIQYADGIVTKAFLEGSHFVFEIAEKSDVLDLIACNLVKEVSEAIR